MITFLNTESDADYLPFVTLRRTMNVVKKTLPPADDSISNDIHIPVGFAFGSTSQLNVYVSFKHLISHSPESVNSLNTIMTPT